MRRLHRHATTVLTSCWLVLGCTTVTPLAPDDPAADAGNATDAAVSPETQSNNATPGSPEIVLNPQEPKTMDDLVVEVTGAAIDPDQGPEAITYRYRWFRDSIETLYGTSKLTHTATKRGETWKVEVSAFDGVAEGPPSTAEITILNTPPNLTSVTLEPSDPDPETQLKCIPATPTDVDDDDLSLEYTWFIDDVPNAELDTPVLNSPLPVGVGISCAARPFDGQSYGPWMGSQTVIIEDEPTHNATALIITSPKSLNLGVAPPGEKVSKVLTVRNIGDGDLEITDVETTGDPGFDSLSPALPLVLANSEETTFEVTFQTDSPGLKKGYLNLKTNAANPEAAEIPLIGVGASPCIIVKPTQVDFGGAYPPAVQTRKVEIVSCGALPVYVTGVSLKKGAASSFDLDLSPGPSPLPWLIKPGSSHFFEVRFQPLEPSPTDENGQPIPETDVLTIENDSPTPEFNLDVSGFASPTGCPVPIIEAIDGAFALPNTLTTLDGSKSFGAFGQPSKFAWSAASVPDGETAQAIPPVTTPTYSLGKPGEYLFHLQVYDELAANGGPCGPGEAPCVDIIPSCVVASQTITVKDALPLRVELTWDTPGDPDPLNEGPGQGADLDLHLHNGTGNNDDFDGDGVADSWFDIAADTYWLDTSPDWGEAGPDDDPVLVLEDPDGHGPEQINYPAPPLDTAFTVGVHYWSDYGYGTSIANVRIYYFETLWMEFQDVVLEKGDFWEVGTILWPSGQIVPAIGNEGGPKITSDYPHPFQ